MVYIKTPNSTERFMSRLMRKQPTNNLHIRNQRRRSASQISFAVTTKLISAFIFRFTDCTIPLLSKCKISSFSPASVLVQLSLCQTCSEITLFVFSWGGLYNKVQLYTNSLSPGHMARICVYANFAYMQILLT